MKEIEESIEFFRGWIKTDLKELDGDTTSDYAKFILSGHKHINVAIKVLEDMVNPTRDYAE